MKKFDPDSIKSRFVTSITKNEEWAQILSDSAIDSLATSTVEPVAEAVRYFEYLQKESKWKPAQNLSSMITEAQYLGYTPRRKISAVGSLVISHDPNLKMVGISNTAPTTIEGLPAFLTQYGGAHQSIAAGTIVSNGT